jgi:hypothetical protein
MASVELSGDEPSGTNQADDPHGVVDELMSALSESKVALALEREAATPLKHKLARAESDAEALREKLEGLQGSDDAARFQVPQ